MLNKACQDNDRVAKHALIFFALNHEPIIRNIFMTDTPRVPPEKFQYYVQEMLPRAYRKARQGGLYVFASICRRCEMELYYTLIQSIYYI